MSSTISLSRQRINQLIRSREHTPCKNVKVFPSGVFVSLFNTNGAYSSEIDVQEVYEKLLAEKVEGIYSDYQLYSIVRRILIPYGFKVKKRVKKNKKNFLPNSLAFAAYWDYSNICIELIFAEKGQFLPVDEFVWKVYSYEIAKTVLHELVHVTQSCMDSKNEDIYNYVEFAKPEALRRSHYEEINYVYEPAEIEAMTCEAVIDSNFLGIPVMESNSLFQINRALSHFDKYSISAEGKKKLESNLRQSIKFWEKFLGIHGKNRSNNKAR